MYTTEKQNNNAKKKNQYISVFFCVSPLPHHPTTLLFSKKNQN